MDKRKVIEIIKPLAGFCNWIECAHKIGELSIPPSEPLLDSLCVTSLNVGGGSDYIWYGDLRKIKELYIELIKEIGDE